ncbi:hypothetical protein A2767_05110 [Candidatus Roizmanbacteria bacterium RIFCSPHIGHO2_01_FULL_35_10]|uniref:Glycosyltransferase RgtA/B/C/D-like domain-containing protein n=1 Tax=Candidatus Roizmanbacteria bacterium RIFCSPLOWO2_01_FULL_35_13 TaxID=1802055 RepID=A0A1F7I725_9BACT|nr:MAG: hypothetical protein A2767_05110 [Candidatus Roizmanbacteria bacterium RIFCSPHIGHO2_01_FULL_35_10]OGK39072.1 MAG: hypothetical protein A3A74_05600 [Candidatus Roizmanbacteria bacterium RIFCSPLOWO2_01_FULL_35_13]
MYFFNKYKIQILLWVFIIAYSVYFSWFSVLRYKTLYASYYDLGIMHQTVFNTYQSLKTGDWSKFLELTNPTGAEQIKRMAIHNDPLLALLAPLYFIYPGLDTLLVVQSIVLALGALAIFKIANFIFQKNRYAQFLSLIFALSYLLYPPLQLANIFEFHAVTLATTLLLFMFYFWLVKKYWFSFIFFGLSLLAKEQVVLTTMMFGLYGLWVSFRHSGERSDSRIDSGPHYAQRATRGRQARMTSKEKIFLSGVIFISIFWFIFSVFYIIPIFRGGNHFAATRYSDFGESPIRIIIGLMTNPYSISKYIFRDYTLNYLKTLLGPVGFLSLLSPIQLLIALPEFAINLLSKNPNMRNVIYHYTAVITPFVFISAIYGTKKVISYLLMVIGKKNNENKIILFMSIYVLFFAVGNAYLNGPLPYAKKQNIHPIKWPQPQAKDAAFWGKTLRDENLRISATGQLSPFFTSRRYFYTFSARYRLADYVVLRPSEIYNYPEKKELIPVYEKLITDKNFQLIYKKENFEVYKKL